MPLKNLVSKSPVKKLRAGLALTPVPAGDRNVRCGRRQARA